MCVTVLSETLLYTYSIYSTQSLTSFAANLSQISSNNYLLYSLLTILLLIPCYQSSIRISSASFWHIIWSTTAFTTWGILFLCKFKFCHWWHFPQSTNHFVYLICVTALHCILPTKNNCQICPAITISNIYTTKLCFPLRQSFEIKS